ncbi:hypothetical protein HDU99_005544 [Rhizoclosmatium hyalinum]|nr:hypothetical protein HDU99_005544 [Rhizoclosmatium hyalinum]
MPPKTKYRKQNQSNSEQKPRKQLVKGKRAGYATANAFKTKSYLSLLDVKVEPFCPSMNANTIALFIRFKRWPKGTPLEDFDGNAVFVDGSGDEDEEEEQVLCQGGWNDPKNVERFGSAVTVIHEAKGGALGKGKYEEKCRECVKPETEGRHDLCRRAHTVSKMWQKGNPQYLPVDVNAIRWHYLPAKCQLVSCTGEFVSTLEFLSCSEHSGAL